MVQLGQLYKLLGFTPVFLITSFCYALAFCIGLILLKDPKRPSKDESKGWLRDIFDIAAVRDTVRAVFAKREPPRRT